MISLAFPGLGVHDYDAALGLFQNFMHDHGKAVHHGGHWVAVPEPHPSGHGWRWHVLVSRRLSRPELASLRRNWTDYLSRKGMEPSGGATFTRIHLKDWETASRAAGYASKYVGKDFHGAQLGKNRRRFLASQGAVMEARSFGAPSLDVVEDAVQGIRGAQTVRAEAEGGRPPMAWAGWG